MQQQPVTSVLSQEASAITVELLNWLRQSLPQAKDFVAEQTPLFVQELLNWVFWSNLIWAILASILTIILFTVLIRKSIKIRNDDLGLAAMIAVFSIFGLIALIATGGCSVYTALKVHIAPRVYMVEYVASLAKER